MNIGKRLKSIRVSKGLSIKQVQLNTGISSIHKLEQGKYKSFKCEHLIILSQYYQISPLYILGLKEELSQIEPKWVELIQRLKEQGVTPREVVIGIERFKGISLRE